MNRVISSLLNPPSSTPKSQKITTEKGKMDPQSLAQSLTPSKVHAAHTLIKPYIHRTPLLTNKTLNGIASTPQTPDALNGTPYEGQTPANPTIRFFFKCENLQRIGAFKARGAFHALLRLIEERGEEEVRRRGVVTHSSGIPFYFSCSLTPFSLFLI